MIGNFQGTSSTLGMKEQSCLYIMVRDWSQKKITREGGEDQMWYPKLFLYDPSIHTQKCVPPVTWEAAMPLKQTKSSLTNTL